MNISFRFIFLIHLLLSPALIIFVSKIILNNSNILLNIFGGFIISCIFASLIYHFEKLIEIKKDGKFK